MEIILKQDVPNLGNADDLVTVRNGYARNFLIPQGFAVTATPSAKKMHAETMKQRAHKEQRIRQQALDLAEDLKNKQLRIAAKVSTTGKIFGSVNNIQLAEAISKKGISVERRNIVIIDEDNIKEVGTYKANVKLYKDVKVEISFEVYAE